MELMIVGGDLRYAYLTHLAGKAAMDVACVGLERCGFALPGVSLEALEEAQAVVAPNPWRSGMMLPLAETPFTWEEVLRRLRPATPLILPDTIGRTEEIRDARLIDLSQDEGFVLRNAHLTAEGALYAAMSRSHRALMGAKCLVIGYGRIGRQLVELLVGMGAQVTVAARRLQARMQAVIRGAEACDLPALPALLPEMQFIFSTPPATVLPEEMLMRISPEALLMDLASPPFGFDLRAARALGLDAVRESGLPGRYCPLSAGEALFQAVLNARSVWKEETVCQ